MVQGFLYDERLDDGHIWRDSVQNVSRRSRLIGLVLAALISGIYATWFAQKPLYNWDMIPYVAIALLDAGQPADTLREKTYDIIKNSTAAEAHEFLLGGSIYKKDTYNRGADYRYMVANDSKIFADQLPLYTVKPVYPALMSLLYRVGVNPVRASIAISGAAYAAICFFCMSGYRNGWIQHSVSLLRRCFHSIQFLRHWPNWPRLTHYRSLFFCLEPFSSWRPSFYELALAFSLRQF